MKRLSLLQYSYAIFEKVHGEARPARFAINCRKTVLQTLVMWLIFLAIGPFVVWQIETALSFSRWRFTFAYQAVLGNFLFCSGAALAWTSAYFLISRGQGTPLPSQAPRHFVVAGPYRYVRNPMAMGSLGQGIAIGIGLGSPLVLLYVLCGILMWNYVARPWEEFDLTRRFGASYELYRQSVRCWLPRCHAYGGECKIKGDQ